MRISDWSSDVCSSDLLNLAIVENDVGSRIILQPFLGRETVAQTEEQPLALFHLGKQPGGKHHAVAIGGAAVLERDAMHHRIAVEPVIAPALRPIDRSEEHTPELKSLMRISYADSCLHKKKKNNT